jgi:hypothetical protein
MNFEAVWKGRRVWKVSEGQCLGHVNLAKGVPDKRGFQTCNAVQDGESLIDFGQ